MCLELPFNQIASLAARGQKAREGAFYDPIAADLWDCLEQHIDSVPSNEQMGRAFAETVAVDRWVADWHELRPGSAVLEIGAGLSTRFARSFAREARYITVDEPAIAELRRELFDGDCEALWQLSGHLEKADWLARVLAPRRPVCVVLEGVLSALHPTDALALLDNLATQLRPGSRVIATFSDGARLTPAQGTSLRLACGASSVCYPGLRTQEVSSRMVVAEAS